MAGFKTARKTVPSPIVILRLLSILFVFLGASVASADAEGPCPYSQCRSGQSCDQYYHNDPESRCCLIACNAEGIQTNFFPSFPKLIRHGAGHPQSAYSRSSHSDGATPRIFAQYDAVAFSTFRIGESVDGSKPQNRFAEEIKRINPSIIVLGIRDSIWKLPGDAPRDYMGAGSYFAHRIDGEIPTIYRNPFPNYTKTDTGRYAITNSNLTGSYDGLNAEDLQFFDGVFFPDGRSGFAPYDLCYDWPNLDFDENGIADTSEHGNRCTGGGDVNEINERWRDGYDARLLAEREMGTRISGKPDFKLVINDGGPPIGATISPHSSGVDFKKELVDGFMIENAPDWNTLRRLFMDWDDHGKKPSLVNWVDTIGPGRWYAAWMSDNQNDFPAMRFHLTTAMLGDVFYGRCVGEGNMACFWYDEYEADLGQPIGDPEKEPVALSQYCVNPCPGNWGCDYYCPYVRFFEKGAIIVNPTGEKKTITDDDLRDAWQRAGLDRELYPGYHRFFGGQDPIVNNGAAFTSVTLDGAHILDRNGVRQIVSGDGILLVIRPDTYLVSDILVGNCNHDDTSPGSRPVELTGSWNEEWSKGDAGGAGNPYYVQYLADWFPDVCKEKHSLQCTDDTDCVDGDGNLVGPCVEINDGYAAKYTDQPGATATFRPTIGIAGKYEVYEWHGWHGHSADAYHEVEGVRVEIAHARGRDHRIIDQNANPGRWNHLGTYWFDRGRSSYVRFTHPGGGGFMIADVVMFRFVAPGPSGECDGDLNADDEINVLDLQLMVNAILMDNPGGLCADLDGNSETNVLDLQQLVDSILWQ